MAILGHSDPSRIAAAVVVVAIAAVVQVVPMNYAARSSYAVHLPLMAQPLAHFHRPAGFASRNPHCLRSIDCLAWLLMPFWFCSFALDSTAGHPLATAELLDSIAAVAAWAMDQCQVAESGKCKIWII